MSERHDGYVMGPIHMVRMEHSEEPWESLDSGPSQNIEIHHHNVHIATVPPGGEQDAAASSLASTCWPRGPRRSWRRSSHAAARSGRCPMASDQPGAGRAILEAIAAMEQRIMAKLDGRIKDQIAERAGLLATDADLDGQWGNPEVKKNPPRWQGDSCVGRRLSECPPEFLDELAAFSDWKAGKDEEAAPALAEEDAAKKRKYAGYARKDAARARGWAARLRAGWKPPEPEPSGDGW